MRCGSVAYTLAASADRQINNDVFPNISSRARAGRARRDCRRSRLVPEKLRSMIRPVFADIRGSWPRPSAAQISRAAPPRRWRDALRSGAVHTTVGFALVG